MKGRGREDRGEEEGERKEGEGRGERTGSHHPSRYPGYAHEMRSTYGKMT